MDDAVIHLRVPAATKARWVRSSRDAGIRLSDWIIDRVDSRQPLPVDALATNAIDDNHPGDR